MAFQSINPATEAVLATFDQFTPQQTEAALAQADAAFRDWRRRSVGERGGMMKRVAGLLRERKSRYAALITAEMGKPIAQAEAEVEKCAWVCDFYAEHAERFLAEEPVRTEARASYVAFEPLGVVLAVMPWNYPFWQVFRFAAPTLMAGNTAVLKHASNVPQCALAIEEVFRDAGLPRGVFRTLLLPGDAVDEVIADPRVRAVSLTGSDVTGEKVAAAAGRALKKTVLELGGSDPFIVLADADLAAAAQTAVKARFQNTGQSCIAAKRFIVDARVGPQFQELVLAEIKKLKVGDPMDRSVSLGPLAREDLRHALAAQVRDSIAHGARLMFGGHAIGEAPGYFYVPTLLVDYTASSRAAREEVFGPVATLLAAVGEDEAIALANATPFGLGASLWTQDLERARELAARIEAGSVFVNAMVASDPRLPFGGVKRSGYGRELGVFGIHEFVNVQTVWMAEGSGRAAERMAGAAVE
jgi:succinate-semialdehyde dehydrogenase/glutarate-semialdehyde dehydrogenase